MKKICKICGEEESKDLVFHQHHIKPKNKGGKDEKENIIDICNDCHFSIHYPEKEDGKIEDLEDAYREAIEDNVFSDGYGILPMKISHDPNISAFSKILYCDISSLCASRGYCWATNEYFAKIFNVHSRTISRSIVELEPYIIIRNRSSSQRTIWVHQLNNTIGKKKINIKLKKSLQKSAMTTTKEVKSPSSVIEKIKYSKEDLYLAELLLSRILYNYPHYENKKINISEWADDIRKLRTLDTSGEKLPEDKRPTQYQIEFMITWVQGGEIMIPNRSPKHFEPHDFWSKNILSAGKLRKQWYDHLIPQLQDTFKKKSTTQL